MESRHVALKFRAPIDVEEMLQGFMLMHATVEGIEETADGSIIYYISKEEWSSTLNRDLDAFLSLHTEASFLGSEALEEHDWNAEWEASITPQRVTDSLVITPSWKIEEARAFGTPHLITIDPKMSFGTGHHETTRLCIRAIELLDVNGRTALDIGTGSGVLAIYALMRGAHSAIGIDTNPWSIQNARENRSLNNIPEQQFEIREGMLAGTIRDEEHFDLILANIHRNVLLDIAGDIHTHASTGCWIVLSGLLIYDVDEVRSAYESIGFRLAHDLRENEWACLILEIPTI